LIGIYRKGQNSTKRSRGENDALIQSYFTEDHSRIIDLLANIGKENINSTIYQIAGVCHLSNPITTSSIIGPRDTKQLENNLGVAVWRLTEYEMNASSKATK
jgi:aryl-alcohol dehydrogenase-like predicted oxidoreductase